MLIVPKSAESFEGKVVSVLCHHFCLRKGNGNFSCGKVNICVKEYQVIDLSRIVIRL